MGRICYLQLYSFVVEELMGGGFVNALSGFPAWRVVLFFFFLHAQMSWAHLPELFGREYIRLEGSPQLSAEETTAAQQLPLSKEDRALYENELKQAEVSGGPYASGLSDPYIGLGYDYLKRGDSKGALEAYRQALHVVRVNDGLNSQRQAPILREIIDIHRRIGDAEALNDAYEYYARILKFDLPPLTEKKLQAALEYMDWERELYVAQTIANTRAPLMRVYRVNKGMLQSLVPSNAQELNWHTQLTLSQLRNFYLMLGDEYLPLQSTGFATGHGVKIDKVNRRFAFAQQTALKDAKTLLRSSIDYAQSAPEAERAVLHLELGDWHQWNGELGHATKQYTRVVELLHASGDEALLMQWLDQPVELPDEPQLNGGGHSLRPGVVIQANYDVSSRGVVQRVVVSTSDEKNEWQAWRLKRMLRDTHFRPRFSRGEAELTEQISRQYMLVGIDTKQ
jgi:tetratricopeptide (TPR) repeat protein